MEQTSLGMTLIMIQHFNSTEVNKVDGADAGNKEPLQPLEHRNTEYNNNNKREFKINMSKIFKEIEIQEFKKRVTLWQKQKDSLEIKYMANGTEKLKK